MRFNKYNVSDVSKRTIDDVVFDSAKELKRYRELRLLEKAKEIKDLALQPKFVLQEGFTDRGGVKHKPISYYADFAYFEVDKMGKYTRKVVEDVKGYKTEVYLLKKKIFLNQYREVEFREL